LRLAVLDTNVLVSAGINRTGAPARLIMDWVFEGQMQLATSPWVVKEYRAVVRREKFFRYGFPPPWLEPLMAESLFLPDPAWRPQPVPGPKDAPFLALAHACGAWLVTGNLRHFPQSVRAGVTVISPADYLAHLEDSE
jgi:uncharacterized protein